MGVWRDWLKQDQMIIRSFDLLIRQIPDCIPMINFNHLQIWSIKNPHYPSKFDYEIDVKLLRNDHRSIWKSFVGLTFLLLFCYCHCSSNCTDIHNQGKRNSHYFEDIPDAIIIEQAKSFDSDRSFDVRSGWISTSDVFNHFFILSLLRRWELKC